MTADFNKNGKADGPYDAYVDANKNNKQDADEKRSGDFQLMRRWALIQYAFIIILPAKTA
jgi:hypothetical protein